MTITEDYPPLTLIDGGASDGPQKSWTGEEMVLVKSSDLSAADVAAMTGRTLAAIRQMRHNHGVKSTRPAGTWGISESDVADAHSGEDDAWPHPWADDGYTYRSCYRCGINMRLEIERERDVRAYCEDCNYPEFRAPFESGSAVEYLSVAA